VHCAVSEENEPFAKSLPTMWEEMMPPGMEWLEDCPGINGYSMAIQWLFNGYSWDLTYLSMDRYG
jgi:hypothetical protein